MNLFNKFEAVGILLSIGIMVLALSVVRFKAEILSQVSVDPKTQSAVVAVSQDGTQNTEAIRSALIDAMASDGELIRLVVDDVKLGTGTEVKEGDTVTVHYIGTTQDGVKFDSSYDRGQPFVFTVGDGKVIEGWEKGLLGMKVGGERILVIPSAMAYGNRQVGPIAPNTTLVFSVELLKIE